MSDEYPGSQFPPDGEGGSPAPQDDGGRSRPPSPDVPPQPGTFDQPPISLAASSLVLGIVGLALSLFCYVGVILSIPAIVTGVMALRRVDAGTGGGRGLAIAGIVTGAIAVAGFLTLIVVLVGR